MHHKFSFQKNFLWNIFIKKHFLINPLKKNTHPPNHNHKQTSRLSSRIFHRCLNPVAAVFAPRINIYPIPGSACLRNGITRRSIQLRHFVHTFFLLFHTQFLYSHLNAVSRGSLSKHARKKVIKSFFFFCMCVFSRCVFFLCVHRKV